MGPLIHSICKRLDVQWCIDIGAGMSSFPLSSSPSSSSSLSPTVTCINIRYHSCHSFFHFLMFYFKGQGYLSQMLVHQYGINVLALDQSENNIQQSIRRGKRETEVNNKRRTKGDGNVITGRYVAAKMRITQDTTLEEICQLTNNFNKQDGGGEEDGRVNFLITGLHCCGGLSSTVLRMFRGAMCLERNMNEEDKGKNHRWRMQGMVLLSCCYHLVNEEEDKVTKAKQEHRGEVKRNQQEKANEQKQGRHQERPEKNEQQVEEEKQERGEEEDIEGAEERQKEKEEVTVAFPMSAFVASSGIVLGSGARLLACYGMFNFLFFFFLFFLLLFFFFFSSFYIYIYIFKIIIISL